MCGVCDLVQDTQLAQTRSGLAPLHSLHEAGSPAERGALQSGDEEKVGRGGQRKLVSQRDHEPRIDVKKKEWSRNGGEKTLSGSGEGPPLGPGGGKQRYPGHVPLSGPQ